MDRFLQVAALLVLTSFAKAQDRIGEVADFVVPDGLELALFAATPMIYSPVSIAVDPNGRVWFVEDLNKTKLQTQRKKTRISIVEDVDKDGQADQVHDFGLRFDTIPLGIAVFDNKLVVALAPEMTVYTDVNRNLKFEPGVDKKDVILSGFHGRTRDHSLHAVQPGPDGRWYFSHGNLGLDVKTPDGKSLHASSYYSYNRSKSLGKRSSDGHLYIGGVGISMDPDGRNAEVIFHNARNTHDLVVTSFGDVLLGDNDDPAHARASWAMKHSNYGYASLEDGRRSWEDAAKSWEEKVVTLHQRGEDQLRRSGAAELRLNEGHWRQNYPGTVPPGVLWGAGAPTGNVFIEGDELGREYRGSYLLCETVNQSVFRFRTSLKDAQIDLEHVEQSALTVRNDVNSHFLVSDVAVGPDGTLFISDWNSPHNRRGRGGKEGAIYTLRKAGKSGLRTPELDFESTKGLLSALRNPAANVRWLAGERLRARKGITQQLIEFYETTENPYHRARVLWLLAAADDPTASAYVEGRLTESDVNLRMTALRALLREQPERRLSLLHRVSTDANLAISREVALHLRDVAYADAKPMIARLAARFDGENRWYLEALGQAAKGKEAQVYDELLRPKMPTDLSAWENRHTLLAWRLQTKASLDDLTQVILLQEPDIDEFRFLCNGLVLTDTPQKRQQNHDRLKTLMQSPAFAAADYQQTIQEFLDKEILDKPPQGLTASFVFPPQYGQETTLGSVDEIAALTGDAANGKAKAALCTMCHRIGDLGVNFGPNLTYWGQNRSLEVIIHNIVNPAAEIAHGFEKSVVLTSGKHRMEGIDVGYSYHAGAIRVKSVGGQVHKIGFRRNKVKIERLDKHSWMPSASKLGLTNQDVRDVAEYLKTLD